MADQKETGTEPGRAPETPRAAEGGGGDPIEAAGGLVWREAPGGREIAVIHRSRYDEWALPKGKPEPGESPQTTALREVREETGIEAEIIEYAGATRYEVDGRPKVVRFWNMRTRAQRPLQPDEEVDRVVWLGGEEALRRLEHEEERQLLSSQLQRDIDLEGPMDDEARGGTGWRWPWTKRRWRWPWTTRRSMQIDRLDAEIRAFEVRVAALGEAAEEVDDEVKPYVSAARELLDAAKRDDSVNSAWSLFNAARRLEIMWIDEAELEHRATMLRSEVAKKLKSWRKAAATELLAKEVDGERRPIDRTALVLATLIRDEAADNEYRRNDVLSSQLTKLIVAIGAVLAAIVVLAEFVAPLPLGTLGRFSAGSAFVLTSVMLFGALGGGLSAIIPLKGRGRGRVPEMLREAPFTLVRPLVGAGAAVGVYAITRMGILSFGDGGLATVLPVAFVAGFSERLLMTAVGRVLGAEEQGETDAPETSKSTDAAD